MVLADAAIVRAARIARKGVLQTLAVAPESVKSHVQRSVGPVDVLKIAVLGAGLLHENLIVFRKNMGLDYLETFGAQRGDDLVDGSLRWSHIFIILHLDI
jgi:hypothetical protein